MQFLGLLIMKPIAVPPLVPALKAIACYQMLVSIAMSQELLKGCV